MAQKKLHLVTGYAGEEHIHSADQGSFNASFFGAGEYVMEAGNQFEASIMDNNTVRILDGDALMKGRHLRIEPNTYADVTITTGTAGVNRNDLIVFQYSKDTGSDIETPEIVVIKGTETEGTATDPAYSDGDILAGATFNQMPMYRVKVEGVVLTAVEPLFEVIPTYKKLAEEAKKEFKTSCENHLNSLNILETKEEIQANTQANQLAGALAMKEVLQDLKASDGTEFRFGINEDGEYGYIVTDSEGADTVIPFSNVKKLYEALKYSGLVTEDMSFEEICAMFAEKYPQRKYYFSKTQEYDVTWDTEPGSFYQRTYVSGTGGNNLVINSTSAIDVTDYSKLILKNVTVNWNNKYNGNTYVNIRGGTTQGSTGLFSTEIIRATYGSSSATVDNVEIDVSNISGYLYLSFYLYVYTGSSGNYAESTCSIDDIYVTNE